MSITLYPSGAVRFLPTPTIFPLRISTEPFSMTGPETVWTVPPRSRIPLSAGWVCARASPQNAHITAIGRINLDAAILHRPGWRHAFTLLPRVDHAMHHRQVRQHGDHPQHLGHPSEQRADNDEHHALGALQKSDLAFGDGILGPRAGVADHHRSGHHDGREHDIKEAIDGGVIH